MTIFAGTLRSLAVLARDSPRATSAQSAFYGNLRVLRAFVVHILYMNHDNY